MKKRVETDSLGSIEVDEHKLWGANTERARLNFRISDFKMPVELIRSIILIKSCYATANSEEGLLDKEKADLIVAACHDLMANEEYIDHFPLDVFQTGSATSTNMNCNEVIANLSLKKAGLEPGTKSFIHPNDHVNLGQSSNDVIPSSIHVTGVSLINKLLLPEIMAFYKALKDKSEEFWEIIKLGRTHLQDAVPIRVGQEISGWADQIKMCEESLNNNIHHLYELPLGGTAVGTGINSNKRVIERVVKLLNEYTGFEFKICRNNFTFQSSQDAVVGLSGSLNRLAVALYKISNDIRHLSSGPRGGIGEYILPSVQAGSSVMPGKVNPVILESALMACCFVMSLHQAITLSGINGNFQLNTSLPLVAFSLTHSTKILSSTLKNLRVNVVDGLDIDRKRCEELVLKSPSLCTPLTRKIGYDKAAEVYKFAIQNNLTIPEAIYKMGLVNSDISEDEVKKLLDVKNLV